MKVQLTLPTKMEATTLVDTDTNVVTIQPQFFRGMPNSIIGRVVVEGGKGAKREFTIMLNGNNGNLLVNEPETAVIPNFDKVAPEEFTRKLKERKKQAQSRGKKGGQAFAAANNQQHA